MKDYGSCQMTPSCKSPITARITKVLQEIIHTNQTGYVKDRFIGEAARSIMNVVEHIIVYYPGSEPGFSFGLSVFLFLFLRSVHSRP